jgi:CheY-like chemotaxis protein
MVIVSAETGRGAIELLEKDRDVEAVLMDVMMPEMDGFETMRAIRQNPRFKELPIIAVTAKAMKGDRERCIEAGAWDYLAKPVDVEELVSMLRGWLVR